MFSNLDRPLENVIYASLLLGTLAYWPGGIITFIKAIYVIHIFLIQT